MRSSAGSLENKGMQVGHFALRFLAGEKMKAEPEMSGILNV